MPKSSLIFVVSCFVALVGSLIFAPYFVVDPKSEAQKIHPKSLEPHDQWLKIRSYPDGFNQNEFLARIEDVRRDRDGGGGSREVSLDLDWQEEGPGNIGGRIDVLTKSPSDPDVIYAGSTNGGIFKTIDGGENWNPIFDDQSFLAIGAITLDPEDENRVFVGTGDRNFSGTAMIGNGIYLSEDAGESWVNMGLEATGSVTEILINPIDSEIIFASTLGNPHIKTAERGVYRSLDGGETWSNSLFIADSAGVIDLVMDPENPNILYAAGFNRMRNYMSSTVVGPNAKIYKTTDGGDTWNVLSGGLPITDESRIGLAISNEDPNTVLALYVDGITLDVKEIYKSNDAGSSWTAIGVHDGMDGLPAYALGGFGWYFGEVYMNPFNNNHLIIPGVDMYQSLDGGISWELNVPEWWIYEVHADKHAILFLDETSYIIGTDGGIYKTVNNGSTWEDIENLPITQFYHVAVDPNNTGVYGGGAQDNGTMSGNQLSFNSWDRLFGGDGFRITYLKETPNAAFYETQNGGLYYKNEFAEVWNVEMDLIPEDRVNWDMPYVYNEAKDELFIGSAHIQLMDDAPFDSYEYISPDLTRVGLGEIENGKDYHTISEIDQPNNNGDILYAGTTDGLMWRGNRTGGTWNWTNITRDLPNRYITGVRCSPNQHGVIYVAMSGYKVDDGIAYLYKSSDYGESWENISSDLPAITVNDILIVPGYDLDEYLFAALDGGVYFSENNGEIWSYVGNVLPFLTVSELAIDFENKKLIAGTFSRSMWSYDISWLDDLTDIDHSSVVDDTIEEIVLYPNPFVDEIRISGNPNGDSFYLYNIQGDLVYESIFQTNKFDVSQLAKGVYLYKMGSHSGKIVKN